MVDEIFGRVHDSVENWDGTLGDLKVYEGIYKDKDYKRIEKVPLRSLLIACSR